MKYRALGSTDLKVAEVGIGTWQLANDENCWIGADLKESLRALHRYVEVGGNFIDTAWIYGYDEANPEIHASEQLIGKFLKEFGKRDQLIIASKVAPKNMQWPSFYGNRIQDVFPDDWIVKSVEDSLRSLGVESIDLMQFHVWQDEWVQEDQWKRQIEKLTKQGKVRYWGISVNDYQPSNCLKTLDTGLISTIQFIFNIFHQKPEEKLLPYAKLHNIGLIARVPLDEGGLTGKFTSSSTWEEGDFRKYYFGGQRLEELIERTDDLKGLLNGEAKTLMELSLRWLLTHPEISTVIPGMRKPQYVDENTSVSDGIVLSDKLMQELAKHVWERNFYDGNDPYLQTSGFVEK